MGIIFSRGEKLENGHYTVVKEIGVGGMGVVYHCRDELLTRDVAIKMLLPELMSDKKNFEVFRQEARLAAQLEHPNLVTVYDVGVEERQGKNFHFLAMEYLTGGNLADRIQDLQDSPISLEHSINWMKQLASGLSFAHKRGVIHQDIKADNVFITNEGDLKIGDFGLARLLANRKGGNASRVMGTPAYMSPELARGEPQDHRSDLYSLGVLFYEMTTGQLPFRAKGMIEMAMKHASAAVPSIKRHNPDAPEILDKVIRRMMAKMQEDRYQSAADVMSILDELIFELRVQRLGISSNRPLLTSGQDLQEALEQRDAQGAKKFQNNHFEHVTNRPVQKKELPGARAGSTLPINAPVTPVKNAYDTASRDNVTRNINETETEASSPHSSSASSAPSHTSAKAAKAFPADVVIPAKPSTSQPPISSNGFISSSPDPFSGAAPSTSSPSKSHSSAPPNATAQASSIPVKPKKQEPVNARVSGAPVNQSLAKLKVSLDLKWTFKTQGPIGWAAQPVIDKEERVVFLASCDQNLYAIDVQSGNKLWEKALKSAVISAPVVLASQIFVVSSNGEVFCFNSATGATVWSKALNARAVAPLAILNDFALLVACGEELRALDVRNGELLWAYFAGAPVVAAPLVQTNNVYIGTRAGGIHALKGNKGTELWTFQAEGPIVSSPFASADSLYVGTQTGNFYSVEASEGGLIWEYPANGAILSRGAIVFTSVVFASHDRWLYGCEKYDGRLKWKAAVKGKITSDIAVNRGEIICATEDGWLQNFSSSNGQLRWQSEIGKHVHAPLLVASNALMVGTVEGELRSYSLDNIDTEKTKSA